MPMAATKELAKVQQTAVLRAEYWGAHLAAQTADKSADGSATWSVQQRAVWMAGSSGRRLASHWADSKAVYLEAWLASWLAVYLEANLE